MGRYCGDVEVRSFNTELFSYCYDCWYP